MVRPAAFATFPVGVSVATSITGLVLAFVVGGLLWDVASATPFYVAGLIGAVGTLTFAVEETQAA